jgi:hypothetical protein
MGLTIAITWPQGLLSKEDILEEAAQVNGSVMLVTAEDKTQTENVS